MKTDVIRKKFLDFFEEKDHAIVPSAPVVPQEDPTALFTTAGMQPLVPYLMGEEHPGGQRIANSQKCIRTVDIDEVGDNRHLTFFEMLGNWSLGDYFKDESIQWSFEFLTDEKWLNIDPKKLYVTVYEGDDVVPKDKESIEIWKRAFSEAGIAIEEGKRIKALDREENWWELGETGPAGPDTEIFYYIGDEDDPEFDPDKGDEFIEIWNNVFMTYQGTGDGNYGELSQKNVDTGMGLERIAAVIQGVDTVFKIDVFQRIIERILELADQERDSNFDSEDNTQGHATRVIADHLRTAVFMAADGVTPSNTAQGYVMRRLIRRSVRQALKLDIENDLTASMAPTITEVYRESYPELENNREQIETIISKEESQFRQTLLRGIKEFEKLVDDKLTGRMVFKLFDTYGFPKELSIEEAEHDGIEIEDNWLEEYEKAMEEQRERSRSASKGMFKGGLAGDEDIHKKYHTATHLMYRALRDVLGDHVEQRGSNITEERLRFDFSHPERMSDEEKKQVEDLVNERINMGLDVSWEEYDTDEALEKGAYGAFGDKYGDTVKVYSMTDPETGEKYSFEICGGPHVDNTKDLAENGKVFKITKEKSSSAGVRRIKAKLVDADND